MKVSHDLLFLGLLLLAVACARIADGSHADTAKDAPASDAQASLSSEVRPEVAKLFGSLTDLDDATPEAVGRHLGIQFSPAPDMPRAVSWEGPTACGMRSVELIPDDQPPGRSIVLTLPMHEAGNGQPACCLLALSNLATDLGRLGYQGSLSDAIDRKRLWSFQARPSAGDASVSALVFTRPESRSEADMDVCVNRINIAVGPRG